MADDIMIERSIGRLWSKPWNPTIRRRSITRPSLGLTSVEVLEQRQLLTTVTISGIVFDDVNGDKLKQGDEGPIPGAVVYLDKNANGILDADDISASANISGMYSLMTDLTGEQHLRIDTPGVVKYTDALVTIQSSDLPNVNLGVARGIITGRIFDDTIKNNTFDVGETPHANVTIYADNNGNATLDTGDSVTTTDNDGKYTLEKVLPGTVKLRIAPLNGFVATPLDVSLKPGETVSKGTDIPLAVQPGVITGTVFIDSDSSGQKNGPERGKSNIQVSLIKIVDGVDQPPTPAFTDVNGKFTFPQMPTGLYKLLVTSPTPGFSSTTLTFVLNAGQVLTNQNFGLTSTLKLNSAPLTYTTGTPEIRVTANTTIGTFPTPSIDAEVILTIKIVGRRLKDRLVLNLEPGSPVEITRGNILNYHGTAIGRVTTPSKGVTVEMTFDPTLFVNFGSKALPEILNSIRFRTPRKRESNTAYVQLQLQTGPDTLESTRKLQIVRFKK